MTETNAGENARCPLYRVSLNKPTKSTVKTRRYKQDAKGADLPQGAYLDRGIPKNVHRRFLGKRRSRRAGLADGLRLSARRLPRASTRYVTKAKRKPDNVLRSRFAFPPIQTDKPCIDRKAVRAQTFGLLLRGRVAAIAA